MLAFERMELVLGAPVEYGPPCVDISGSTRVEIAQSQAFGSGSEADSPHPVILH